MVAIHTGSPPRPDAVRCVALIGCGALGQAIIAALRDDTTTRITDVLIRDGGGSQSKSGLPPTVRVIGALGELQHKPDLILEVASHSAVATYVPDALRRGIDVALASIGALADDDLYRELVDSARCGGAQLHVISGAIGGIDALTAYREGALHDVAYIGRKPPAGWRGTPAAERFDLASLKVATVIFEGSAREAARLFPKNANVAATVALAGLGFDRTRVRLIADPAVLENIHRVEASADVGSFVIELTGKPLPDNPRTSALTALSCIRALRNLSRPITL
jgi:aspartate dehydrogenase